MNFPPGFVWGVAASAYQIEGAVAEGGRSPSIWDTFAHTPGKTLDGDTGDIAIDHYHRFIEDVAIMAGLGVDSYRFSISWSRLLPAGVGTVNPEGVEFYRGLCEALRSHGIAPLATLYHWDLPQTLQDRGGWLEPRSADWFAEYAVAAKSSLGDLVDMWATHNEPWCAAFLGHGSGTFAPGISDPAAAFTAAHHLMVGHHRAIAAMRVTRPSPDDSLGIVLNVIPALPADATDPADVEVARVADLVHNRLFLDAAVSGSYPPGIEALHRRFGVDVDQAELTGEGLDYLGLNYYNINRFAFSPISSGLGDFPGADGAVMTTPPGDLTEMGWGVEPDGLGRVLRSVGEEHPDLPLYVTENGAAYDDVVGPGGTVDDPRRIAYMDSHIAQVADVIADGVDVRGYYAWSIFDNFEWSSGFSKRFGLVRVDYDTLERTPKSSAHWYRDLIARH